MSSGLIIVVDDNATFRKMYSDFLSVHGYTVLVANGGAEALRLLRNCTPKALLLDISMPNMDGIEACRQMRRIHGNDIPIVFLTASNDIDKLRECLHAGGDDYLIKSGDLGAVMGRIKFWSAAPNRQDARERRAEVLREVDQTAERIEQEIDLAKGKGKKIDEMSRLMATAQTHADEAKLTGKDNKLYVIGYASGIVSHWADTQMSVKANFMKYLRATLSGSYLLSREDIREVMENFDCISKEPLFKTALLRAGDDCRDVGDHNGDLQAMENGADEFAQPTLLGKVRQDRF